VKLIVFAHRLELGGTQINAIELAANLRDRHGYDVLVHATHGSAIEHLRAHNLRYVPAPDVRFHPSYARIRCLRELVRHEKPDMIHAWDWWQGLEAYLGAYLTLGVPLVISDMMMTLSGALPREVPLTLGFEQQRELAQRKGWRDTYLLLPPVNIVQNAPNRVNGQAFRSALGVKSDQILLVSVSRMSHFLKSDSLVRAIKVVRDLGTQLPLKLVLVGDGEARAQLQKLADETNAFLRRDAVVLAGAMRDPRPAYAAADIVLGMGGSALRGMAFEKPVIVLGEHGFARLLDVQSAGVFLYTGMFGRGDGSADNRCMTNAIYKLARDASLRHSLGQFGRRFVTRYHGLDMVADGFARYCEKAVTAKRSYPANVLDLCRTAMFYIRERRFRVASRDVAEPQ
jgi:L-malate glycosyltransferase